MDLRVDLARNNDITGAGEHDVDDSPNGLPDGDLDETTPGRVGVREEGLSDRRLESVADPRPRARIEADRQIGAKRVAERDQDGDRGFRATALDVRNERLWNGGCRCQPSLADARVLSELEDLPSNAPAHDFCATSQVCPDASSRIVRHEPMKSDDPLRRLIRRSPATIVFSMNARVKRPWTFFGTQ